VEDWIISVTFTDSVAKMSTGNSQEFSSNFLSPILELSGHEGFIGYCTFVDEKQLLTTSGDHSCGLWDLESGRLGTSFKSHSTEVMMASLSPADKNMFLSASSNGTGNFPFFDSIHHFKVKLWDMRNPKPIKSVRIHEKDVNGITWFPSGNAFATGSDDQSIKVYDIRASAEVLKLDTGGPVTSLIFSSGGNYIFSGQVGPFSSYNST
jgi:guanine nucleotide-binding protein G(I)/G(S)/G(T) subunit beta-1